MAGNNSNSTPAEMTPTRSTATIASTAVLGTVEDQVTLTTPRKLAVKWQIKLDRHTPEEINEFVEMRTPAYYEKRYEERQKQRNPEEEVETWRSEVEEKKRVADEEKKRKSDEKKRKSDEEKKRKSDEKKRKSDEKKRKSDEEKKRKSDDGEKKDKQKTKTTRRSKGKEKVYSSDNATEEEIDVDTEEDSPTFIPIAEYEIIEID